MADTILKVVEATTGTDLGAIDAMQGVTPVKIGKQVIVDELGVPHTDANPFPITGTENNGETESGKVLVVGGSTAGGSVQAFETNGSGHLHVSDGGGSLTVDGTVAVSSVAGTVTVVDGGGSLTVDGSVNVGNFPATQAVSGTVSVGNFPTTQGVNITQLNGATPSQTNPIPVLAVANNLAVTAVGAAAAAVTLTLPASAGNFHYIDSIEITCYASAAGTGGATPVTVTSTNLNGLSWTFPSARAIGTIFPYSFTGTRPLKSQVSNTATTIVCPATTGVIWRVTVTYTALP